MIVAGPAEGSLARSNAAAPATTAADAEVPVTLVTPDESDAATPTPGAAMKTALLWLLPAHAASDPSVAPTPTTLESPAGYVGSLAPSFPAAAITTTPADHA